MKRFLAAACAALLMLAPTGCRSEFDGSRTGSDQEFSMEYRMLDRADSQELVLQPGECIQAELVVEQGTLAVTIGRDGEAPLYEGSGIAASCAFTVEAETGGSYTVTVSGSNARGSVLFTVVAPE